MVHYRYSSGRRLRRRNGRSLFLTSVLVAISMSPVAFFANLKQQDEAPLMELPQVSAAPAPLQQAKAPRPTDADGWALIDPRLTLKPATHAFTHNAPSPGRFTPPAPPSSVAKAEPPAQPETETVVAEAAAAPIPLPVPRPPELRIAKAPEPVKAVLPRPAAAPLQTAAVQPAPAPQASNNPSFIEKLFGIKPATPPEATMSYAAIDPRATAPRNSYNTAPSLGDRTAVYDISARTVYLPNGERLEAHSGLGDKLDDPRFVHVRMKGATPPGTYVLTEREALFHGVRALRMNPVGGSAAIHGRDGILAHTYMLGPNGDSNGCISFKDYNRFLQAYLKGEVNRIVVVAGSRQDPMPRMVNRGQRLTVPERDT